MADVPLKRRKISSLESGSDDAPNVGSESIVPPNLDNAWNGNPRPQGWPIASGLLPSEVKTEVPTTSGGDYNPVGDICRQGHQPQDQVSSPGWFFNAASVSVRVIVRGHTYHVHESVLTSGSPILKTYLARATLNPASYTKMLHLPGDIPPITFRNYVTYCYFVQSWRHLLAIDRCRVHKGMSLSGALRISHMNTDPDVITSLVELWRLSNRFQNKRFMRIFEFRVADAVSAKVKWLFNDFTDWHVRFQQRDPLKHHLSGVQGAINGYNALDGFEHQYRDMWKQTLADSLALALKWPDVWQQYRNMVGANSKLHQVIDNCWKQNCVTNIETVSTNQKMICDYYVGLAEKHLEAEPLFIERGPVNFDLDALSLAEHGPILAQLGDLIARNNSAASG